MSLFKKCENTSILARFILRRDRVRTVKSKIVCKFPRLLNGS
jgi:hypothetical protein